MAFVKARYFCMNFAISIFISNLIWRNFNDKVDVCERCSGVMVCMQDVLGYTTEIRELNGPLKKFYNQTVDLSIYEGTADAASVATGDTSKPGTHQNQYAGEITANGNMNDVQVFGVKSDKGTGDAFMVLPLTVESTEFFVASWP